MALLSNPNIELRPVSNVASIGALVRERRKRAAMTQAQAAALAGVGTRFLSELERGKETVELNRVLQVLHRLGFELMIKPRGPRSGSENALRSKAAGTEPQADEPKKGKSARRREKRG